MKSYDVAVIGGDGTGPEVTREALKVCETAARKFGFRLNWQHYDFGGDRYLKYAFEIARKRRGGKPWKGLKAEDTGAGKTAQLTLCGKTNVLTYAFDLWFRAFNELAPKYPTVKPDYAHVDAICMWFVKNPEWFDVLVTDNMFGDIITDIAALSRGGFGDAAGVNVSQE